MPGLPRARRWAIVGLAGSRLGRRSSPPSTPASSASACAPPTARTSTAPSRSPWRPWIASSRRSGRDNVELTLGYVGTIPSSYPINAVYQWTRGPEEAILCVALERAQRHRRRGSEGTAARRARAATCPSVRFSFEPADIVNEVMSFGSPTPVEVAVSGPKFAENRAYAAEASRRAGEGPRPARSAVRPVARLSRRSRSTSTARRRACAGVTPVDVSRSLVAATSSSRFTVPNYWADPKTGIGYQVQVEIPRPVVRTADGVEVGRLGRAIWP